MNVVIKYLKNVKKYVKFHKYGKNLFRNINFSYMLYVYGRRNRIFNSVINAMNERKKEYIIYYLANTRNLKISYHINVKYRFLLIYIKDVEIDAEMLLVSPT